MAVRAVFWATLVAIGLSFIRAETALWPQRLVAALAAAGRSVVPVVATTAGGIPELVTSGREALLVPPGEPDLLAAALMEVAGDPERRAAMSRYAIARAATLDAQAAVRRTEALYREMTAR